MLHREILGNVFGLASAISRHAPADLGLAGRHHRQRRCCSRCSSAGIFDKPQDTDLWGQAGRQIFFPAVSLYGWWRWYQYRKAAADSHGVQPRWATSRERVELLILAVVLYARVLLRC